MVSFMQKEYAAEGDYMNALPVSVRQSVSLSFRL